VVAPLDDHPETGSGSFNADTAKATRDIFMNSPQYRVQWMQDFDLQS
jgi:hypothetical protein